MTTILRGSQREICIGLGLPIVLIGNRIDAAAPGPVAEAIRCLDLERIAQEARAQAAEGAEVIAVQTCAEGIDQVRVLPAVVEAVSKAVLLPLCIQTENPAALKAALKVCPGKPLVGTMTGKPVALNELLPVAAAHGAAVIASAIDNAGIPRRYDERIELMRNILRTVILGGVARQDIILNPAVEGLEADPAAAAIYLQAAAHLSRIEQLGVALEPALAVGALDDGEGAGRALVGLGARAGVACVVADPALYAGMLRDIDLLLDRPDARERRRVPRREA